MTPQAIHDKLKAKFGDAILAFDANPLEPFVKVKPEAIREVCGFLKTETDLAFDYCMCISGVDTGKTLLSVYHLYSMALLHRCSLKAEVSRENPHLPSVASVWRAADWHEREAFDLFGIVYDGHPDLRRILLPDDWEGHPLRKDYPMPDAYHDIPLK